MDINELVSSVDILEYVKQFVDLEERNGEWWGISPFTYPPEKTPSFSVSPPFFYDYSAGFGGNIFTFVQNYNNCSPSRAVDIIMEYAGVDGEITSSKNINAVSVFKRYAPKEQVPNLRKKSSGVVLPDNYMDRYEIRDDKLKVWKDEGISDESLERFQVRYDSLSNRIVYPIRDMEGRIVNVGGRALDSDWKERGQRKYCYFYPWGSVNTIYGLFENLEAVKENKEVVLFEGCKSVLIADTWGIKNTAAILTSHLNLNQASILAQLGCDVVFALDKGIIIRNDKHIQLLKRYVKVYYVWDNEGLIDVKDSPVDGGKEVFQKLYQRRYRFR